MVNRVSKIQTIVERVRVEFEEKRVPKDLLSCLYTRYNPEIDGNRFVAEAEKLFPKLNCGLTSVYLQDMLGGNVIQGKYRAHNHTFLLVGNLVVDITADQYDGSGVYIGELKFPWTLK